jgi:O-antigen/teichoic acid export membrane protein
VGEYGIYGLVVYFVIFFLGISGLGIYTANSRFIAYYRGRNEEEKILGVIKSSFLIVGISSILFSISLFLLSDFLAINIFGIERFSIGLKIFVISIPFWAIIKVIVSIFRGFESAKEKVYFVHISIQVLKAVFFLSVIFLSLALEYVLLGFLFSVLITFVITIIYYYKKFHNKLKKIKKTKWHIKEILSYSWPLIFTSLTWFLISGIDKTMLGIFKTEVELGLYNAATPIAKHLIFFYTITVYIFQPIASRLYANGEMKELKRNYQVLNKWLFTT